MASELMVKRLLKQAGVSVLAGLLMSSAVLAEDMSEPVGEPGVVSVDDGGMVDGIPEVAVDPVDSGVLDGTDNELGDPADGGDFVDGGEWTGGEDGVVDDGWTGGEDPTGGCIDCSGVPEIAIDPREMDGTFNDEGTGEVDGGEVDGVTFDGEVTMVADGPIRGTEPNHRGNVSLPAGDRGQKAEHYQGEGKKAVIVLQSRESLR